MAETFIVLIGHVVGNPDAGFDIVTCWDGRRFSAKPDAVSHGFRLAGSDDFQIGVVRDGRLVSVWWMDRQIDELPEDLAARSREIGLK